MNHAVKVINPQYMSNKFSTVATRCLAQWSVYTCLSTPSINRKNHALA